MNIPKTHTFMLSGTEYRLTRTGLEAGGRREGFTADLELAYDDKVTNRVRTRSFTVGNIRLSHQTHLPAPEAQPELEVFRANMQRICEAVERAHPEMLVTFGSKPKYQKGLFGFGVLALLAGVGLIVGVAMSRLSVDRMIGVGMPVLLLLIIGGAISYSYAPWRPLSRIPVASLPASVGIAQLVKP